MCLISDESGESAQECGIRVSIIMNLNRCKVSLDIRQLHSTLLGTEKYVCRHHSWTKCILYASINEFLDW